MGTNDFKLCDFMDQLAQVRLLGPMHKLMGIVPGVSKLARQLHVNFSEEQKQLAHMQGIIHSMTEAERQDPDMLTSGRRRRIAAVAGVAVPEVQQFIKQFQVSRCMGLSGSNEKLTLVSGLVTNNPLCRDPSWLHPMSRQWIPQSRLRWLLFAIACTAAVVVWGRLM